MVIAIDTTYKENYATGAKLRDRGEIRGQGRNYAEGAKLRGRGEITRKGRKSRPMRKHERKNF